MSAGLRRAVRRSTRLAPIAFTLLALAGCGGGTARNEIANEAPAANQAATAQATGARLAALPEAAREAVFYRALPDAGMACQQVDGASPGGLYQGMPVWNATCRGGGHWTLVIGNDETVQILNANEARLVTDRGAPPGNAARR